MLILSRARFANDVPVSSARKNLPSSCTRTPETGLFDRPYPAVIPRAPRSAGLQYGRPSAKNQLDDRLQNFGLTLQLLDVAE